MWFSERSRSSMNDRPNRVVGHRFASAVWLWFDERIRVEHGCAGGNVLSTRGARHLAIALALVAGGCGGTIGGGVATTTSLPPVETAAPVDVSSLGWARVAHDEAVFGGGDDQVINSVVAEGPGLVAVGSDASGGDLDAAVWTSSDGLTWSRAAHDEEVFGGEDDQSMSRVIAGGPGLVAVGSDGTNLRGKNIDAAVWTSSDGITWSRVPHDDAVFGGDGDQVIKGVAVGGPGFVAVGSETIKFNVDAAVWTSPDGITWSRVPHDEAVFGGTKDEAMLSVVAGGPGLVSVGSFGKGGDHDAIVWTSTDGLTWSLVAHDEAVFGGESMQVMHRVVAGGPGLLVFGLNGPFDAGSAVVWFSTDGTTWTRVPHHDDVFGGRGAQTIVGGVAAGPGIVAVGWDGPFDARDAAAWASTDGISWARLPHDDEALGGLRDQQMLDVVAAGPGLVAVGFEGPGLEGATGDSDAAVWVLSFED